MGNVVRTPKKFIISSIAMGNSSAKKLTITSSNLKQFEEKVCKLNEIKDGEMKEVSVRDKKVLLIKEKGEFFAIGSKCSHYAAPLVKGTLSNGYVRCPWHGACFNIKTGDLEDYPGLDSIPKFCVNVVGKDIVISGDETSLENFKRTKSSKCTEVFSVHKHYLIVGGGASAITCAETLRQEGFAGKITIATKENSTPYDRPKISKVMDATAEKLALRTDAFYKDYNIDILLNKKASNVCPEAQNVFFSDGDSISYDKLLIATGTTPRKMEVNGSNFKNICTLRDPIQGNYIAENCTEKNFVIIGSSFIGMESAAWAAKKCSSVTVVCRDDLPFRYLGTEIGFAMKKFFEEKGVKFVSKANVKEFQGNGDSLKAVILSDESSLPADICLLGIGSIPATDFLKNSGIDMTECGFVNVNKFMQTNIENIFAAGDIAKFPLFINQDKPTNIQHWQMAKQHGRMAALNMLDKNAEIKSVPFFWSVMFGKSLRFAGYNEGYDDTLVDGSPNDLKFVLYYLKNGKVIAAASLNSDPVVAQVADSLLAGVELKKSDIQLVNSQ